MTTHPALRPVPTLPADADLTTRQAHEREHFGWRFPVPHPLHSPLALTALATLEGTRRFAVFQREVIDRFGRGEIGQKEAQLEIEHYWAGALRRAVVEGDVETGSLMAGQSVGMVTREQPAAEILAELAMQAAVALQRRDGLDHALPGAAD